MKRYTKTFWNGMLEDPKGIWVKEENACIYLNSWIQKIKRLENQIKDKELENIDLFNKFSDLEHDSFIYAWICLLSLLGNVGQLIYQMNT